MSNRAVWTIDPQHTHVDFSVRHLMISTVKGRFGEVEGTVTFDPADARDATVDVRINAASIDTRVQDRDNHLRSPDFLDVANHPVITFAGKRVDRLENRRYRLLGDLTIRGVTREVPLEVELQGTVKDPWGNEKAGYLATGVINRHDYGLDWNAALEAGGVVVGAEVKIALEGELTRQIKKAAA
jgi:polyisoprenoid-binding protein YceI